MNRLFFELRVAARSLSRHPGTALLAVVALALGIGLTGAMFSIVNGALRELPFEESHRLIHLERNNLAQDVESMEVPLHDLLDWRSAQSSFEGLAAFYTGTANLAGDGRRPERYEAAFISPQAFPMLRVQAATGRTFLPSEEGPASPAVAILGYSLWQERFAGDPGVVDSTLRINGEPHTVIGVMPEGFRFPFSHELWLPLRLDPADPPRGAEDQLTLEVFGRLRDGVSFDRAGLEMTTIAERLAKEYPESNEGVGAVLKPYTEEYVGEEPRQLLTTMLIAVFGVLLIACANVANLLLARATLRTREVAVRSALGARRVGLAIHFLAEALVLAGGGVLAGVGLAWVAIRYFNNAIASTDPPFWIDIRLALPELAFVVGLGLLAALVSGLVPAIQGSGPRLNEVLKDDSRGSSSLRLGRFGKALVVAEVALSCGLLVSAGLMIRSITNLRTLDYGFATDDVMTARIGLFESDYPDEEVRRRFWSEVDERVGQLAGVEAAALTTAAPGLGGGMSAFELEGAEYARPQDLPRARQAIVTPGFLAASGVGVVSGRGFDLRDRAGAPPVVVVNRSFVELFLKDGDPLGRRLRLPGGDAENPEPWRTVVGVVPDLAMGGLSEDDDQHGFYLPLAQNDARFMTVMARTGGDPMALVDRVRQEVNAVDPDLPLYFVNSLSGQIAQNNWHYNVFGTLFLAFGVAALFLATVGLYGVMAFSVGRRTHEVGIRLALGARPGQVVALIFRQGAFQLVLGLLLGVGLALALSRGLEIVLFRVDPWDPGIFILVIAALAATGALACLLPARRAAGVDPALALHHD